MSGCRLRLWRFGRGRLRPVAQCEGVEPPEVTVDANGAVRVQAPGRSFAAVPTLDGYWFEVAEPDGDPTGIIERLQPVLGRLLDAERETLNLAKHLAAQYEEIEVLYTISEIFGRTVTLSDAAQTILEELSAVVGAQRASLFVYGERSGTLRPIAAVGQPLEALRPVELDDAGSITARVFREGRLVSFDPRRDEPPHPGVGAGRGYQGTAFLSVPVVYRAGGAAPRPIGVLNLTDRFGTDAFSGGERRLVTAVAAQLAAAVEHARLVQRDMARQRLQRELELARRLQQKLLPAEPGLGPEVDAAARCEPAERVGGDFYHFVRVTKRRVGVMLGDISSHGFAAAMMMAMVRAAAGIHVHDAAAPDHVVRRLFNSVSDELTGTEMFLTLFYGVVDARFHRLRYTNAGHAHAFRVTREGTVERLAATSPPLGLAPADAIAPRRVPWVPRSDILVLMSDGIVDARNAAGARFGEERALEVIVARRSAPCAAILAAVFEALHQFKPHARDDRTLVLLRA